MNEPAFNNSHAFWFDMGNFRRMFIVSEFCTSTLFKKPGPDAVCCAIGGGGEREEGGGGGEEEEEEGEERSNLRETIDRHTTRPKLNCKECR